jgi:hypothetical protein
MAHTRPKHPFSPAQTRLLLKARSLLRAQRLKEQALHPLHTWPGNSAVTSRELERQVIPDTSAVMSHSAGTPPVRPDNATSPLLDVVNMETDNGGATSRPPGAPENRRPTHWSDLIPPGALTRPLQDIDTFQLSDFMPLSTTAHPWWPARRPSPTAAILPFPSPSSVQAQASAYDAIAEAHPHILSQAAYGLFPFDYNHLPAAEARFRDEAVHRVAAAISTAQSGGLITTPNMSTRPRSMEEARYQYDATRTDYLPDGHIDRNVLTTLISPMYDEHSPRSMRVVMTRGLRTCLLSTGLFPADTYTFSPSVAGYIFAMYLRNLTATNAIIAAPDIILVHGTAFGHLIGEDSMHMEQAPRILQRHLGVYQHDINPEQRLPVYQLVHIVQRPGQLPVRLVEQHSRQAPTAQLSPLVAMMTNDPVTSLTTAVRVPINNLYSGILNSYGNGTDYNSTGGVHTGRPIPAPRTRPPPTSTTPPAIPARRRRDPRLFPTMGTLQRSVASVLTPGITAPERSHSRDRQGTSGSTPPATHPSPSAARRRQRSPSLPAPTGARRRTQTPAPPTAPRAATAPANSSLTCSHKNRSRTRSRSDTRLPLATSTPIPTYTSPPPSSSSPDPCYTCSNPVWAEIEPLEGHRRKQCISCRKTVKLIR